MIAITSSLFWLLLFPHNENILTIDKLDCLASDLRNPPTHNVPLVINYTYAEVGESLFKDSSLMGTFPILQPPSISSTTSIHMILTLHLDDSLDSLSLCDANEPHHMEESMPLMEFELVYNVVHSTSSPMAPV